MEKEYSNTTQASHDTVELEMLRQKNLQQKVKAALIVLLCFLIVLLLLYFILPMYQCKNIMVKGNIHFGTEEVATLSGNDTYRPLIFLDKKQSSDTLLENSQGFIASADFETDGFSSHVTIKEDYPVGTIDNVVYFGSGRTIDTALSDVDSLKLTTGQKDKIKKAFQEDAKKLPQLFIQDVESMSPSQRNRVLFNTWQAPHPVISLAEAVCYSDSEAKVADFIFSFHDSFYLLKNLRYDRFSCYFDSDNFPEKIFNAMESDQKDHGREEITYPLTSNQEIRCFPYTFSYSDKDNVVRLVYYSDAI